ncbi:hypothetical protein ACLOJK_025861 [Asimina triloba]
MSLSCLRFFLHKWQILRKLEVRLFEEEEEEEEEEEQVLIITLIRFLGKVWIDMGLLQYMTLDALLPQAESSMRIPSPTGMITSNALKVLLFGSAGTTAAVVVLLFGFGFDSGAVLSGPAAGTMFLGFDSFLRCSAAVHLGFGSSMYVV